MKPGVLTLVLLLVSRAAYGGGNWRVGLGFGFENTLSGPAPASLSLGIGLRSYFDLVHTFGHTFLNPAEFTRLLGGSDMNESTEINSTQLKVYVYKWLYLNAGYSRYKFSKSIIYTTMGIADMSGTHKYEGAETGMGLHWEGENWALTFAIVNYLNPHKHVASYDHIEDPYPPTVEAFEIWDRKFTTDFNRYFHSFSIGLTRLLPIEKPK